jgi:ABC-2 type transport system ATP-binding protein
MSNNPSPDTSTALLAADLVKTYSAVRGAPRIRALDGLSLEVDAGTVFGLLGPNGAGKSTTVRVFSTLSKPDSGRVAVAGPDVLHDPVAVRQWIGLVSQKASSDPMSTARENLVLAAQIQGMSRASAQCRANELLTRFCLEDDVDRLAKTYSGGMARKLDVAIGLVHRPEVLFLDEPTTGLDPEARADMWSEIEQLSADEQVTVLLTTNYLDEADRLADRLAIVDHGRVVVEGTPEQLKSELQGDTVQIQLLDAATSRAAVGLLSRLPGVHDASGDGVSLRARASSGARAVPALLAALEDGGVADGSVTVARPSLDDVYLRHVGRRYEVAA